MNRRDLLKLLSGMVFAGALDESEAVFTCCTYLEE